MPALDKTIPWGTGTPACPLSEATLKRHIDSLQGDRSTHVCQSGLRHLVQQSDDRLSVELGARAPGSLAQPQPDVPLLDKNVISRRRLRERSCD